MNAEQLYELLKKSQEPKGYFLNADKKMALELISGLIVNRERYGYASCPCRLASGNREWDQDIICPCVYREKDVRQYGQCYCALYLASPSQKDSGDIVVPERRPPEKTPY
ncbi:MAG: ferredoxin:thioredoxin reductase [Syntrophobacterales bacterium]|nr:ferredoxin:thioredoxin reductase [Syntrophobacterales bacterium]